MKYDESGAERRLAAEIRMTAQIVAAYVKNHDVTAAALPKLITSVHGSLANAANGSDANGQRPAVAIERSITPDYLICLEDGRRLKMLKRYLKSTHGLTPEQYREKWRLPRDYPMVAPNYVRSRSEFAKRVGLGKRDRKATRRTGRAE